MKIKRLAGSVLIPMIAIALALLVGAVFIMIAGKSPVEAYSYLLKGAFGSKPAFGETLVKATPLIFTGLAATISYKCGMYNLGGEGQFLMGAVAAVWIGTCYPSIPAALRLVLCLVVAGVAGLLWGAIPGLLRTYRNVNEMIITIMLNQIAVLFMSFMFCGPLKEANIPQTAAVDDSIKLARFFGTTRAHTGIFIALIIAVLMYYFMYYTYKGFQFRAVGYNMEASRVNGFSVQRIMMLGFMISGAIAGLGGGVELLGSSYRLQSGFGSGFGFNGVAIALIGQLHPLGTVLVAYLFAVLNCGANAMQAATGITTSVIDIIEAIIIIFSVVGTGLSNAGIPKLGKKNAVLAKE